MCKPVNEIEKVESQDACKMKLGWKFGEYARNIFYRISLSCSKDILGVVSMNSYVNMGTCASNLV